MECLRFPKLVAQASQTEFLEDTFCVQCRARPGPRRSAYITKFFIHWGRGPLDFIAYDVSHLSDICTSTRFVMTVIISLYSFHNYSLRTLPFARRGSSWSPTATSAVAVGSAPLLRRGRTHGLASGPQAGSRVGTRAEGRLGSNVHQVSDEPLRCFVPAPAYLGAEHEEPLRASAAELWVGGSPAPLCNPQRRAVVRCGAGLSIAGPFPTGDAL